MNWPIEKGDKYSLAASHLVVKRVQEEARVIEGWATTPAPDRVGDIINPSGAKFALPLPLLFAHDHGKPIGRVESAKVEKSGIRFSARISKIDEPGTLKERVDEAWQSIKAGIINSVSIGFKPTKATPLKGGGLLFDEWDWFELSICTVPANPEALITSRRSVEMMMKMAEEKSHRVVRLGPPKKSCVIVRLKP